MWTFFHSQSTNATPKPPDENFTIFLEITMKEMFDRHTNNTHYCKCEFAVSKNWPRQKSDTLTRTRDKIYFFTRMLSYFIWQNNNKLIVFEFKFPQSYLGAVFLCNFLFGRCWGQDSFPVQTRGISLRLCKSIVEYVAGMSIGVRSCVFGALFVI